MGTRVKFAEWRMDGRIYRVKPPDWPKTVEYSCTDRNDLIEWARNNHYMLKQMDQPRQGGRQYA